MAQEALTYTGRKSTPAVKISWTGHTWDMGSGHPQREPLQTREGLKWPENHSGYTNGGVQ